MAKFQELQQSLVKQIRTGQLTSAEPDESRRINIYQSLFYNNIEDFCASTFPVLKKVLGHDLWHKVVRSFFEKHHCETPHFIEISQEFLVFLSEQDVILEKAWLIELAHYEWVELAVATAPEFNSDTLGTEVLAKERLDQWFAQGDLSPIIDKSLIVPESTWPLSYQYPVQTITTNSELIDPEPTCILVYRDSNYEIQFINTDGLTVHILTIIKEQEKLSVAQVIELLTSTEIGLSHAEAKNYLQRALVDLSQRGAVFLV